MLRSMTAYGRGELEIAEALITVEIRSVNHRFRDVVVRIPRSLQPLEDEVRSQIATRVGRGRIECSIQMEHRAEEPDTAVALNVPLARAYVEVLRELQERFDLDSPIHAETLCQFKDVVKISPVEEDLEAVRPGVETAMSEALDALDRMRAEEGRAIEKDFRSRLLTIRENLARIEERAPVVVEAYRKRLRERVESLSEGMELDEGRLLQEVALFAGRCDITEETVRSQSHLSQFEQVLALNEPVGRRLDFLVQELHREVNTISSKASDASISSMAVEVKGELEKLKEQVQNVE
ncbi:MAG: YicC/YloC family endoribonuclease [Desulfobacteraceae bacterium]